MPLYRCRVWRTVGLLAVREVEAPDHEVAGERALEEGQALDFDQYTAANMEDVELGLVEEIGPAPLRCQLKGGRPCAPDQQSPAR